MGTGVPCQERHTREGAPGEVLGGSGGGEAEATASPTCVGRRACVGRPEGTSDSAVRPGPQSSFKTPGQLSCLSELLSSSKIIYLVAVDLLFRCSVLSDFATQATVPCKIPLSIGFPRQEYWSGLPFPSPGDLPDPGITPTLPHWHVDSLPWSHQGSPGAVDTVTKNEIRSRTYKSRQRATWQVSAPGSSQ